MDLILLQVVGPRQHLRWLIGRGGRRNSNTDWVLCPITTNSACAMAGIVAAGDSINYIEACEMTIHVVYCYIPLQSVESKTATNVIIHSFRMPPQHRVATSPIISDTKRLPTDSTQECTSSAGRVIKLPSTL